MSPYMVIYALYIGFKNLVSYSKVFKTFSDTSSCVKKKNKKTILDIDDQNKPRVFASKGTMVA